MVFLSRWSQLVPGGSSSTHASTYGLDLGLVHSQNYTQVEPCVILKLRDHVSTLKITH